MVTVGSLLTYKVLHSKSIVWGSGMLLPSDLRFIPKIFPIKRALEQFFSVRRLNKKIEAKIYAVRGVLTKQALLKVGCHCPSIYGDPGILLPIFYMPKIEKRYKVGIVLHHSQREQVSQIAREVVNFKFISPQRQGNTGVEEFIDEISSCEKIFTSSLHGLILAQAYHIPVQWIKIKGLPIHRNSDFKFFDYFSGIGQSPQYPLMLSLNREELLKLVDYKLSNNYINSTITKELLNNFPL